LKFIGNYSKDVIIIYCGYFSPDLSARNCRYVDGNSSVCWRWKKWGEFSKLVGFSSFFWRKIVGEKKIEFSNLSASCRLFVGHLSVIENAFSNLSASCRLFVGHLSVIRRPFVVNLSVTKMQFFLNLLTIHRSVMIASQNIKKIQSIFV